MKQVNITTIWMFLRNPPDIHNWEYVHIINLIRPVRLTPTGWNHALVIYYNIFQL